MGSFIRRYAFGVVLLSYAVLLWALHAARQFPRAGLYDLSRLVGSSHILLEGTILDFPIIRWDQTRFLMEAKAHPLSAFRGRVLITLSFADTSLAPGDRV